MYHTARRYVPEDGYIHCSSILFPAELIKPDKSDFTFQYIQKHTIRKRQRTLYYSKNRLATVANVTVLEAQHNLKCIFIFLC
jgi:hypothetical protein